MSLKRLDHIIAEFFPQYTRSKAQSLIERGRVKVQGQEGEFVTILKPGRKFATHALKIDNIKILPDEETRYVSRGALKLKQVVEQFNINVKNKICLDVGLSTGGFSDYLLQAGVKKILGIDVGQEQLHSTLRANPSIVWFDKVNAREPLPLNILSDFFADRPFKFDLVVVDVSFISLEKIIPNLISYIGEGGGLICLVKPQFELTRKQLNKKGVVKDSAHVEKVVEKIVGVFRENQLEIIGTCPSPIEGENGNKEVLLYSILPKSIDTELMSDKA